MPAKFELIAPCFFGCKWSAFSVPEKLKPPQSYQKRQTKKKNQPER